MSGFNRGGDNSHSTRRRAGFGEFNPRNLRGKSQQGDPFKRPYCNSERGGHNATGQQTTREFNDYSGNAQSGRPGLHTQNSRRGRGRSSGGPHSSQFTPRTQTMRGFNDDSEPRSEEFWKCALPNASRLPRGFSSSGPQRHARYTRDTKTTYALEDHFDGEEGGDLNDNRVERNFPNVHSTQSSCNTRWSPSSERNQNTRGFDSSYCRLSNSSATGGRKSDSPANLQSANDKRQNRVTSTNDNQGAPLLRKTLERYQDAPSYSRHVSAETDEYHENPAYRPHSASSDQSGNSHFTYADIKQSLIEKDRPSSNASNNVPQARRRTNKGDAWRGATEKEMETLDSSINQLSMVPWAYETYGDPKMIHRRACSDVSDHVRLLRPIVIDGMSLSMVYNRKRPFRFDGTINRFVSIVPDNYEVLSTKAFLLILHYYLARGHLARIIVPRSYIESYEDYPMTDDSEVFEELLDAGLVGGCDSFEELLQIVNQREACLVMDVSEYHRFHKTLPRGVQQSIGVIDNMSHRELKRDSNFVDLSTRFVQPYFTGPEKRLILPSDNSIYFEYKWMDDRMAHSSLIHGTVYKKMMRYQLSFDEQIRWLKKCDGLLTSGRELTEQNRFQFLLDEFAKKNTENE